MTIRSALDSEAERQRARFVAETASDHAIYMLDPHGTVASWNGRARDFTGYLADEIIGHAFSRFFTDEDRAAGLPDKILHEAAQAGRCEQEGWRIRKDGGRTWTHAVIDPVYGHQSELLGYVEMIRTIHTGHQANRALYDSEQRFRLLVQGVRDYAIYMLDLDGRVINWNAGAEAIKGYSAEDIIGEHFSRFYTEEDRARGEPERALRTALEQGRYEREAERVRKDGSRFWANVVIDPIHDEQGRLVGYAKITRDVTEKRRAQEELEEARAALFQAQKLQALGELTGGIAHDFNNLMTVIRGSAELLQSESLTPEKRARYVQAIIETADRATTLTGRLLTFGRRQAVAPEVIDLGLRLDALGEVLARTLDSAISVRVEVDPDAWRIEADPAEFETALLNAAFNARDAMPSGGELLIAVSNLPEEEAVRIAVSDTGEGIAEDLMPRVFEPFFTTKPVGKGTGLGLSQIHGFAAQAGGRAELVSERRKGTTVSLILPRSQRAADPIASRMESGRHWEMLDVLLVEDSDVVRTFARSLLEELKAKVTEASSAREARRLLKQRRFDLVFTDIVMPGMSGLELARLLRSTMPDQPVLLATGYSKEVSSGEAAGFQIVRKPYGAETLTTAIAKALAARHPPTLA